jgi:hypothetical protein
LRQSFKQGGDGFAHAYSPVVQQSSAAIGVAATAAKRSAGSS